MAYVKRNFLLIVIITVNCMTYTLANPPIRLNPAFRRCIVEMNDVFNNALFSPLRCIKLTIEKYNDYSNIFIDHPMAKNYYLSFNGKTDSEVIDDRDTFCTNMFNGYPASPEGIEELKKRCMDDTVLFGTTKDQAVYFAIHEAKADFDLDYINERFGWFDSFSNDYLAHIKEVIVLRRGVLLDNPWTYCYNTYPDEEQKKPNVKHLHDKPENEASSSGKRSRHHV